MIVALNSILTCQFDKEPLETHFYIVKLGFTGLYFIFLILAQNRNCWYFLEPPQLGGSNEFPQPCFGQT